MRERLTDGLVNIGHDILVGSSIKIFEIFGVGGDWYISSPRFKLMVIVESQEERHQHQRQGPIDCLSDWVSETRGRNPRLDGPVSQWQWRRQEFYGCRNVRVRACPQLSWVVISFQLEGAATGAISPVGAPGGGGGASAGRRGRCSRIRRNICPKAAGQYVGVCGSNFLTV